MENRWGNNGNSDRLYFGGSKITAGDDFSHEIKRLLFLERKAMTNLDSILKSRDITLPANFHIVKPLVFPVIMYGCVCVSHSVLSDSFETPWTVAHQAPLSMGFSKEEH